MGRSVKQLAIIVGLTVVIFGALFFVFEPGPDSGRGSISNGTIEN